MRKKQQRRQGSSIYTWQDGYWDSIVDYNGEHYSWEEWNEVIKCNTYDDRLYLEDLNDTYDDELIMLKNNTYEKLEIK
ncbi:hypothetical protein BC351_00415 [Paenibacillus ferrarius]|uniref:Uncharacterized protein n=1 Tax=Paenibacillus ferrarius TaxID=1469647 RepID=A0A1V4HS15_9BACL|nr:hypothetical protein [Paenibacillus ferrarius]OPH61739.1 hypothetical protein BC351_00415 [Paenibacillus ferrarius]